MRLPLHSLLTLAREYLLAFFYWWIEGLKYPLPEKIQTKLFPRKRVILIHIDEDSFQIHAMDFISPKEKELLPSTSGPVSSLAETLHFIDNSNTLTANICLDKNVVLTKTLTIPNTSRKELDAIIGFELERLTPFNLEQIYYDYQLHNNALSEEILTVLVYIIPKQLLHPTIEALYENASGTISITSLDEQNNVIPIDLLALRKNFLKPHYLLSFKPLYALAFVLSGLLLLQLPLWRSNVLLDELSATVSQNRHEALTLRQQIAGIETSNNLEQFMNSKLKEYRYTLDILKELTEHLPDDAWLHSLSLSNDVIELHGLSPSAADTLAVIENISFLEQADFSGSLDGNSSQEKQTFRISARVIKK